MNLTAAEQKALREQQLAVFEDRIIHDARPPIDDTARAAVEKHCAGPLPEALVALWRTSFGGALDYDLRVNFGDHEATVSLSELFYPGSNGYHDLFGWIENDKKLAREHATDQRRRWTGKLDYLPFGGFEHLDRVYVKVAPGADHGAVVVSKRGLPPPWVRAQDGHVASDVRELFHMLALEKDPTAAENRYAHGRDLLAALDALAASPAGKTAAKKLRRVVDSAILDWRAALVDGSIRQSTRLRHLALEHAARNDEVELLARMHELGCPLTDKVRGGGTAIDHALGAGSMAAVRFLLDHNVPVVHGIRNAAPRATSDLVRDLLSRGAEPDPGAVMTAIEHNHLDGALEIARALCATDSAAAERLTADAALRASSHEQTASRIESGQMGSNRSPAEYRSMAARFRRFAQQL